MSDAGLVSRVALGPMARRLLAAMALAAVLPTLAAVAGSYLFFRDALFTELSRAQREVAFRASDRLSSELDAIFLRIHSESHNPHVFSNNELFIVAVQLARDVPELDAVFWLDEAGRERFRWERMRVVTEEDFLDRSDTPLYTTTRTGLDFIGTVEVSAFGEPTMSVAVPLHGTRREGTGALGAVVNLKTMWERTRELESGAEGVVYAVDERGRLIGHPNPSLVLQRRDVSTVETVASLLRGGEPARHRALGLTGEPVHFAGAPVRRTGWLVVVETPIGVALRGQRDSLLGTLAVLAIVLGVAGLYVVYSANLIAQPLRQLTERSRGLAGDAAPVSPAEPGGDEVEVLTQAFDRMQTALSEKERGLRWNAERLGALNELGRAILGGPSVSGLAGLARTAFTRVGIDAAVAVSELQEGASAVVSAAGELAASAERIALADSPEAPERSGDDEGAKFLDFPRVTELKEVGRAVFVSRDEGLLAPNVVDFARQLADTLTIAIGKARLEERLERERAYVSQIIDAAPTIICTLSPEGVVRSVNPALREMTGLDARDVVGRPAASLAVLGFEAGFAPPEAGKLLQWEARLSKRDGEERVLSFTASSRPDGEGGLEEVIIVGTDVTEQRRLETRLRLAQKMEAVGQLAGGIAHDFNNLLTVIVGYSTLLLGDESLDQTRRTRLEHIAKAADRAASLVQQLLAFSRRQVMHPLTIELNEQISELKPFLSRLLEENIHLVFALAPDLWPTRFDPVQLEQVVLNLAVNSRDAMPGGGSLTFKTANLVLETPMRRGQAVVPEGQYVTLTVSDTGEGIDSEKLDRVFEPFFTTKDPGKGTGLGLSTVYGIIKQSGGYIFVSSERGRGTKFELLIPRAEPVRAAAASGPEGETRTQGETILVVEDDERVRRLVVSVLKGIGYRVLEAQNGRDALGVAKRFEGEIDVLVTDAVMPRLSGPELARELKKTRPEMRVLVTSGYLDRKKADIGPEAAFLEKPFTPDVLSRKIREVLERREA